MDHLDEARRKADHAYAIDSEFGGTVAEIAIAHALIALVERLDKLIDSDGLDPNGRGYLRVDTGRP